MAFIVRLVFCAVFCSVISLVTSERILGIVHMPAYSHFQLGDRIFRELAAKGHDVTVITPYELKTPTKNLKHVLLTGLMEEIEGFKSNFFKENTKMNIISKVLAVELAGLFFEEYALKHENVQKLLRSNEKFDLVIYENFISEAFTGFAHHYKAQYIALNTFGASRWSTTKMGNPNNPAYMPDHFLSYSSKMNFFERLHNTLVYLGSELFVHFYINRKHNELLQKYFPGAPHLNNLMFNASLMLLNSHPSIGAPVPLLPNMIEIGGYHVQDAKPLPKDLQDYLDNAKDGVIFFSMGSNMKSTDMTEERRTAILNSFKNLKEKILWKWENDVLPGQPDNVKLAKWLPQQDILAHPNVKLFITHGGMLSTIEAIHHGVPVLGIPVFGDQELNIGNAENAGYGVGVLYNELTEAKLTEALNKMLSNKMYSENVKQRSKTLRDQQTKPLDKAIYWIEYVIRHQGAPHLRTAALNLTWYQYFLLDVTAFILFIIILSLWLLYKTIRIFCCKKSKVTVQKSKKRN